MCCMCLGVRSVLSSHHLEETHLACQYLIISHAHRSSACSGTCGSRERTGLGCTSCCCTSRISQQTGFLWFIAHVRPSWTRGRSVSNLSAQMATAVHQGHTPGCSPLLRLAEPHDVVPQHPPTNGHQEQTAGCSPVPRSRMPVMEWGPPWPEASARLDSIQAAFSSPVPGSGP